MSNTIASRFSLKRNNVKTFLFFLVFTSFLWIFIQFSKNYTQEVDITIKYINIPKDKIINSNSDHTIRMTLNGNGFRLMSHKWSSPTLELNAEDAVLKKQEKYFFYLDKESSVLKSKLDFKGKVLALQKDTLQLLLDQNSQKKIPVKVNQKIAYAIGYGSDKGVKISPDSVTVKGPSQIIDTIQYVYTEDLNLENLNIDHISKLKIKSENLPGTITIQPKQIKASVSVSKFTEGNQKVPVTIYNIPEGTDVKIFPKEISVVYRVGLDRYNEINARDFLIVADYAKISEKSSFLTLELKEKPEAIHDVRMQKKQVEFVVLK
ncbi:CdaR family protein [Aquimarina algicola]|uniref:YbbR-like domain-containing protein n=1 Tax=Aquimarina algicola TaxID=2589995 RepID=A0A504IUW3_9FLAO|nr:CdaR family protein [Aquimarina algicola]TPN82116.1 YbbR-like domain-containing protein [Aquimarina algicola]